MINNISTMQPQQQQMQFDFNVHRNERTQDTTTFVRENAAKFSGNCKTIMQHFQKQNIPLTDDNARLWLNVKCLAQRIADIRENGIVILDTWVKDAKDKRTHKMYQLGCTCPTPKQDFTGCWIHDDKLKV